MVMNPRSYLARCRIAALLDLSPRASIRTTTSKGGPGSRLTTPGGGCSATFHAIRAWPLHANMPTTIHCPKARVTPCVTAPRYRRIQPSSSTETSKAGIEKAIITPLHLDSHLASARHVIVIFHHVDEESTQQVAADSPGSWLRSRSLTDMSHACGSIHVVLACVWHCKFKERGIRPKSCSRSQVHEIEKGFVGGSKSIALHL